MSLSPPVVFSIPMLPSEIGPPTPLAVPVGALTVGATLDFAVPVGASSLGPPIEFDVETLPPATDGLAYDHPAETVPTVSAGPPCDHAAEAMPTVVDGVVSNFIVGSLVPPPGDGLVVDWVVTAIPGPFTPLNPGALPQEQKIPPPPRILCVGSGGDDSPGVCGREGALE